MTVPIGVIAVLCVYISLGVLDQISMQLGPYSPLFGGAITGLIMGDLKTGLIVGATLQLMTLGVATFGGATVPDFLTGSVMGTAYAIIAGKGAEYGIGLAVPIGLLLTQTDILARMANTFVQHRADHYAELGDYKKVERCNVYGVFPWILSRIIPVAIGLIFGQSVVSVINSFIPTWFMDGLKTAGLILPAMGIAILMRYLPIKKYFSFFIFGFVMMAYGGKNFSILGAALVGLAMAGIYVLFASKKKSAVVATGNEDDDIEVDDDDEVEIDE
ncbi:PTS mannose/fructose/sorbose/N-acetylgalactosamine transporter subunit IIC [Latilactobacillus graminis]|uniref:Phosphotransferase system, mannose fructose N-acetylgalactosamine-specific n=2 Tax=Latilactobacillus graminis TaxID=60519 RepID=A0AA89I5M8_9LACO|nr:PTS sugar transporter subunit IIC [Latilactobacillus graminis]KRM23659.1 Phosphotransferase system, mannose fructose N-acetylgalactosamine-specific [Latilactobacillus graminis DSM 20719]QFP80154.1 PTS sugar transporter subunit IIC [Latilactobacillus graminis]